MSDTYVQLAAELDAYSAGVLPPLKRTKPPTGDEIRRSMRELITHIDQTLVSVAGRLRAMDASLKEQQQQQTGDDQPIPPRTPQEVLDQLQLSVASPTKRRRHSWKSLGNRLRKVIKQVHEKEAKSHQQAEKNQRYQEQREAEGKDLWSWRPPGNKPEPKRRRPRKLPPAASEVPTDLTAGISPAINVVELDTAHLERSPLATSAENLAEDTFAAGSLPESSPLAPDQASNSSESTKLLTSHRKPRNCPRRHRKRVRRQRAVLITQKTNKTSCHHVRKHCVGRHQVPHSRLSASTLVDVIWGQFSRQIHLRSIAPWGRGPPLFGSAVGSKTLVVYDALRSADAFRVPLASNSFLQLRENNTTVYTETEGSRKAIGDVDVLYHDGLYHLFHLVLPNHDFIAHAVSTDGINWRRVNNAIFIGDPGSWDDLMLWTMAVSPNPHQPGQWRMFYTGLSRREQGNIQRIGLAISNDLFHWHKVPVNWHDDRGPNDPELVLKAREIARQQPTSCRHAMYDSDSNFPLEADPEFYESNLEEGRQWVSFRDPYYYREGGRGWLIMAARTKHGPIVRRGAVGVMEEVAPGKFEARPPLHHPGLYDDIEVPNLLKIENEYYLIGSLREDAKIRYWHNHKIGTPWRSYYDNVLLAQGNYAARICQDEHGWLLWNFFTLGSADRTSHNLMPPPKRLKRGDDGMLRATTFEGLERFLAEPVDTRCVRILQKEFGHQTCSIDGSSLELSCDAGFQAFVFDETIESAWFSAKVDLQGLGKCGIVFRVDPETQDGYYLSLDLLKGVAQLRAWHTGAPGTGEHMMQFRTLQGGNWHSNTPGKAELSLIAFGHYLELSVDGRVILSLADPTFTEGLFGVYLESAAMNLSDVDLRIMRSPEQSANHLATG